MGPDYILKFFGDALPIFALGFFVIALAIYEWESIICDKTATLYTDKTGAFGAVLDTGSTATSVDSVDMRLWYLIAQFRISLWLVPVSTDLDIADFPTRDKAPPFASESYSKFSLLQEALSFARRYRWYNLSPPSHIRKRMETRFPPTHRVIGVTTRLDLPLTMSLVARSRRTWGIEFYRFL